MVQGVDFCVEETVSPSADLDNLFYQPKLLRQQIDALQGRLIVWDKQVVDIACSKALHTRTTEIHESSQTGCEFDYLLNVRCLKCPSTSCANFSDGARFLFYTNIFYF